MNLLEEIYAEAKHPPVAAAFYDHGSVCLFDDRGRPCAVMGVELAHLLGWLEDDK